LFEAAVSGGAVGMFDGGGGVIGERKEEEEM